MTASFTCPGCGAVSHNPNDVHHGWCDRCQMGNAERAVVPGLMEALGVSCAEPAKLDMQAVKVLSMLARTYNYLDVRAYPDSRQWCCLAVNMHNVAILRGDLHDTGGFGDSWEYPQLGPAILALNEWDSQPADEPAGWIRHPRSHRRLATDDSTHYDENDRLVPKGEIYVRP